MITSIKKFIAMLCFSSLYWLPNALAFPERPVKIIISLPVGSGPDVQLRNLAQVLGTIWKQPVIVENRPGGSGMIAMNQLQKESANGHSIALLSMGDVVAFPILYARNDLLNTLEPLAPFFTADMVLFASSQITNSQTLRQELARNPLYGSWAAGSIGHVAAAEFASALGVNAKHVAYKEYGPWYIDTSNRALAFGFTSFGSGHAMYKAGKINYIAIASDTRDPNFPHLPTVREAFGQSITAQSWLAFYISKEVPDSTKKQLERDLRTAMSTPEVQQSLIQHFFLPQNKISLSDFRRQVERDRERYQKNLQKHAINITQ